MLDVARRDGWTQVAFGDVVRQVRDVVSPEKSGLERFVAGEHMDTDQLRIRRWGTIGDGYLGPAFHMRFKPGHVLYGSRRTYLRKVALADFEGITANTTFVLESKDPRRLLPELLPFIMQTESFHEHSKRQSKGSVNPYVNFSDLTWYELYLPPVDEQRRIVHVLQALELSIDSYLEVAAEAEKLYRRWSSLIFGRESDRGAGPESDTDSSCHWVWKRVGECFDLQLGKMSSKKAREGLEQTSYIKNNNVLWDQFVLDDLPQMSFGSAEREKFSLRPGDLLVCEGGEIGRAAIWKDVGRPILYQKALHRLRPRTADVSPRFALHYLRYCADAGELDRIATGSTILHLPQERLATLRFPAPDVALQVSIADRLDRALGAVTGARQRVDQLSALKSTLMTKTLAQ